MKNLLTALFFMSISQKFSARILHAFSWPQCAAACSGVQPSKSFMLTFTLACINKLEKENIQLKFTHEKKKKVLIIMCYIYFQFIDWYQTISFIIKLFQV